MLIRNVYYWSRKAINIRWWNLIPTSFLIFQNINLIYHYFSFKFLKLTTFTNLSKNKNYWMHFEIASVSIEMIILNTYFYWTTIVQLMTLTILLSTSFYMALKVRYFLKKLHLQKLTNPCNDSKIQCFLHLWSLKKHILLWLLSMSCCPWTWEKQPYEPSNSHNLYHQEIMNDIQILILWHCPSWTKYIQKLRAHPTRTRCLLWS